MNKIGGGIQALANAVLLTLFYSKNSIDWLILLQVILWLNFAIGIVYLLTGDN